MSDIDITMLIPTRDRASLLAASVRLYLALAAQPDRVETLLYADDDDPTDYGGAIWARFAARGAPRVLGRVIRGERHGYRGLNWCYTRLAQEAQGRWCFLWNDDAFMATPCWDDVLRGVPGEVAVAWTESNHGRSPCTFPAFTRSFSDAMGHVSLNTHNDTWIEEVSQAAGVRVNVPILVVHGLLDEHPLQYEAETSKAYYSEEMKAARARDVEAVRRRVREG